jgi:hypothetical protein
VSVKDLDAASYAKARADFLSGKRKPEPAVAPVIKPAVVVSPAVVDNEGNVLVPEMSLKEGFSSSSSARAPRALEPATGKSATLSLSNAAYAAARNARFGKMPSILGS